MAAPANCNGGNATAGLGCVTQSCHRARWMATSRQGQRRHRARAEQQRQFSLSPSACCASAPILASSPACPSGWLAGYGYFSLSPSNNIAGLSQVCAVGRIQGLGLNAPMALAHTNTSRPSRHRLQRWPTGSRGISFPTSRV